MRPDRAPEWYANIDWAEWLTPPPLALGSRFAFVARFLGRRLAYTYEAVMASAVRRANRRDLAALAQILESGEDATAG